MMIPFVFLQTQPAEIILRKNKNRPEYIGAVNQHKNFYEISSYAGIIRTG